MTIYVDLCRLMSVDVDFMLIYVDLCGFRAHFGGRGLILRVDVRSFSTLFSMKFSVSIFNRFGERICIHTHIHYMHTRKVYK